MADTFNIFREDSVPVLLGVPKEVPSLIKGKTRVLNVRKNALGDVSNVISQKTLDIKPNEANGKSTAMSCSTAQQEVSVSCKPVSEEKEQLVEQSEVFQDCKLCSYESDLDILPKSNRLAKESLDILTTSYPYEAPSPAHSEINYFTHCISPTIFLPSEIDDLCLEDVPVYDSDLSDLSF